MSCAYQQETRYTNCSVLSAGQRCLQKQNSVCGRQPPSLGQACAFDIQKKYFVQIISNGYGPLADGEYDWSGGGYGERL